MTERIDEIAREICHLYDECETCQICNEKYPIGDCELCYFQCIAKEIITHDYRKVERGEWIAHPRTNRSPTRGRVTSYNVYCCSVCERSNGKRKSPFCPHCGADMRGEKDG